MKILIVLIGLWAGATAADELTAQNCTCYKTNSSSSGYFLHHQFFDYRNLNTSTHEYRHAPAVLDTALANSNALATSSFFLSSEWKDVWSIQTWNRSATDNSDDGTRLMVNSANNIYLENSNGSTTDYNTTLVLRTSRLPTFQASAEIDSQVMNYEYMSARFLARVVGAPGACAGMFTYRQDGPNDKQDVYEADIEILTEGPTDKVQYTNQPSVNAAGDVEQQASQNSTMPPGRTWSEWNTYRMDWMPNMTSWYVNGISVSNNSFQVPTGPSQLIINMWSDGSDWTGNMSVHQNAYLELQWVEVVYNLSSSSNGSCAVVCDVDGVDKIGTPQVDSAASRTTVAMGWVMAALALWMF